MRARGFTLTELVLILVLIGIMAAFVAPRLDILGFERQSFARELTIALRHAQRVAIAAACPVVVDIDSGGYAVRWGGGDCGSQALSHPSRGGEFSGAGDVSTGTGAVRFDARGRTAGPTTIVVTGGATITVEAGSGYVRS